MTAKIEPRMREIRFGTRQYRNRYETRLLSCLTLCSLFLQSGISVLFISVQTPGIPAAANGYGGVLRDGAGTYMFFGIAAFLQGLLNKGGTVQMTKDYTTTEELTFRSNASFGDFIQVELDGKTLDERIVPQKKAVRL